MLEWVYGDVNECLETLCEYLKPFQHFQFHYIGFKYTMSCLLKNMVTLTFCNLYYMRMSLNHENIIINIHNNLVQYLKRYLDI